MDGKEKKIIKLALASFAGCSPLFFIILLIVPIFLILGLFGDGGSNNKGSIVYESACNYEETKVTVMDGSNKEVLATVSLEDYLIGVICPEIGACSGNVSSMEEHYIKVKFVTARTYVLARSGYNSSDKTLTIRASTRDQQWCDLEKGCVVTKTNDVIPGYSDQYFYNTYPGDYSTSKMNGTVTQTYSYTEEDLEILHQYYKDTYGDLYLLDSYNSTITSLSGNDATEYKSDTQRYWRDRAKEGKNYEEILDGTGASGITDSEDYVGKSLYKLGTYCKSTRVSSSGTFVDLGEYPDVFAATEVTKQITTLLSDSDIDNLNSYIKSNVEKAGYGTGEGVAAAAQSLIYGLYQLGYYLPYWYGGGHALGITDGVDENWGKTGIDTQYTTNNSSRGRTTYSYDCSGFVSWAIKNACKNNFSSNSTSDFISYGSSIELSKALPGDLMVIHQIGGSQHVRLIVKNNGDGSVIVAESTAGGGTHGGIQFKTYSSASGYSIIDMDNWYKKNCN